MQSPAVALRGAVCCTFAGIERQPLQLTQGDTNLLHSVVREGA
jgi:hypothetical protein